MKTALLLMVSLVLLGMACTLSVPASSSGTPESPTASSPVSSSAHPVLPPKKFPTCQPAKVPPFQLVSSAYPSTTPTTPADAAVPTLRSLAEKHGMYIGTSTAPSYLENPDYAALAIREFNTLVPGTAMKWEIIHPQPERYDFTQGDAIVNFARAHNMTVFGHTLVWDLQQPDWLTQGEHTRDEWIQILCQHIKTVVGHYRGQIYAWQVVNESFNDDGSLRDTLWLRKIGPEYIAMAFQWAHEADPEALMIYNDNAGEGMNAKSQAIYTMVKGLLARGIPIDGVGLQMHVRLYGPPTPQDLAANMKRLADLGLEAHITEMDVRLQYSQDSEEEELAAQAEMYRQALAVCLAAPNCNVFVTWGLTDRYSWIPGYTGHPDAPLLFDESGQPKPAYFAIMDLLR
jgi:endo-1,4-beta-xylanase